MLQSVFFIICVIAQSIIKFINNLIQPSLFPFFSFLNIDGFHSEILWANWCLFVISQYQAENQLIKMQSTDRGPRWKVLSNRKAQSKSKFHQERSRYTPKRSENISERDFTLPHLRHESQNMSSIPDQNKNLMSSQILRFDSPGSLEDNKQKISDNSLKLKIHRSNSPNSECGDKKSLKILHKKSDKSSGPKISEKNEDNLEDDFKGHLHQIEKISKQFQIKKSRISQQLECQQSQIENIKDNIIQRFSGFSSQFHDPNLVKIILKHRETKQSKIDSSIVDPSRGFGHQVFTADKYKIERSQSPKNSLSRSLKSQTASQSQNTFNKIFEAINNMKQGLNQFKKIRTSKVKPVSKARGTRLKAGK